MKNRPLALIIASLLFLYFPSQLIWDFFHGGVPTSADILLSFFVPIILVVGLLKVNQIAWYTLFGFVFLFGIRDFQFLKNEAASVSQVIVHLFVYILGVGYFINPKVRRLYFDPKLQWWRTKERYEVHGPVIVESGQKTLYANLKNMSEGGCFLESARPFEISRTIDLFVPLPRPIPEASLRMTAEVRWVSSTPEMSGMGVQFLNLDKNAKQRIKRFLRTVS